MDDFGRISSLKLNLPVPVFGSTMNPFLGPRGGEVLVKLQSPYETTRIDL